LGLSQPLSRQRVFPSPQKQGGEGTLACGWGVGGVPIPTRGIHCGTLYMYVLCGTPEGKHSNQLKKCSVSLILESTEYIFNCKRAILFLSSSKILTLPSPSLPGESVLPPQQRRGVHTRRAERGWGVNILEDERNRIALLQLNIYSVLESVTSGQADGVFRQLYLQC
jgi:hypothetical protein